MSDNDSFQTTRRTFSKEEKVALVLLIIAGIGGLFFGFRYLHKNLQAPISFTYQGATSLSQTQDQSAEMEAMKQRDTDKDGLSDYDEVYVYKTSPYLADSDSDGFTDSAEIASGNDPNCPVGKTCNQVVENPAQDANAQNSQNPLLDGLTAPTPPDTSALSTNTSGDTNTANTANDQLDVNAIIQNMTPDQLRQLLIANGAEKAQVDKLTDDQLMQLYRDTLAQQQQTQTTP